MTDPEGTVEGLVTVIVDDDENDRYLTRRFLGKHQEFGEVLEARTGNEFLQEIADGGKLELLTKGRVLVLMDINMPGLNGFQTAEALAERVARNEVPASVVVLMFTSSNNPQDRARAEAISIVQGYIVKPIGHDNVKTLLEHWQASQG
ncbi:MAG: response regulator [Myxococcota bacterium]